MKNKLLFALFFALMSLVQTTKAQAPDYLFAKSAGGTGKDFGQGIATDADGNIVVAGYFQSPLLTCGNTILTNAGGRDVFIVKYDAAGNVLWAKSAGGTANDIVGIGISIDASGNVLLTGSFESPTITFGNITLTNAGRSDIFIVNYSAVGNVVWAKSVGGVADDFGRGASFDPIGNVLVTGSFNSSTLTFGGTSVSNEDSTDIFVAKYNSSGNALWAQSVGGFRADVGQSICSDAKGNVLVTGYFESSFVAFDTTILFTGGSRRSVFIAKYDGAGNVLWAKSAEDASTEAGIGICTDPMGNILVTGYFESRVVDFGNTTLTNSGARNIFIVKYDDLGTVLWAKSAGGTGSDTGVDICTDAKGNVLVTGYFDSPSITFGAITYTNSGFYDIFVAKYDANGNVLWSKHTGGTGDEGGNGIATDAGENVFLTGSFDTPTTFGATILSNIGGDFADIFVAKIAANTVGIEDNLANDSASIYPNPCNEQLFIELTNYSNATAEILNTHGQVVQSNSLQLPKNTLQINDLPSGIYFVKVKSSEGILVKKFIKN